MPIADMPHGAPTVSIESGRVFVAALDNDPADPGDRYIGFALRPAQANLTALRILAAVGQLDPKSVAALKLQSIEGARIDDLSGRPYARLEIELDKVTLPIYLDRAILAQLVDDLAALLADLRD